MLINIKLVNTSGIQLGVGKSDILKTLKDFMNNGVTVWDGLGACTLDGRDRYSLAPPVTVDLR